MFEWWSHQDGYYIQCKAIICNSFEDFFEDESYLSSSLNKYMYINTVVSGTLLCPPNLLPHFQNPYSGGLYSYIRGSLYVGLSSVLNIKGQPWKPQGHSKRLNHIQLAQMKVEKKCDKWSESGMDLECNEALILLSSMGYNSLAKFSLGA